MAILDAVKKSLRLSHNALDGDITDLIDEARQDLIISGISIVKANDDQDTLIKRAIKVYVKANFITNNDDAARYQKSYDSLKTHLALAGDYQEQVTISE